MTAVDDAAEVRGVERPSPWPGLASFREEDQGDFHGRDAEIEELFSRVERERLTVVYGISGLGKTSLLRAGLFPRLRRFERLPVYVRLDHAGDAPKLADQVRRAITAEAERREVALPAFDHESLWETFHRADAELWSPRNELLTPVLVFDQFEEIFTLGRRRAAARRRADAFLAELADLVEGRAPLSFLERLERQPELGRDFAFRRHDYKVVISLREEFLPEIEGLRELMPALAQNRFRLCRMSGASARQAVRRAGGDLVAPGVAEEVVRFVAAERPGERADLAELEVEPALLSVVCRELDNQRRRLRQPQISSDLLAGGREEILSDLYERGFKDVPRATRAFVEEKLLTVSGFRDSVAWDNALETPGVEEEDLNKLVERRLLRIEETGRGKRVELIHDLLTGVAAGSRDRRRLEEELAAEQLRQRQELEQRRQEVRRHRRIAAGTSALALIALLAMAVAFLQRREARESQLAAQRAVVRSANLLIEGERVAEGVAYLAQSLQQDPTSWQARALLFDILLRRAWPRVRIQVRHDDGVRTQVRHDDEVLAAHFSSDGRRVVTASADHTARLWDAETGALLNELAGHKDWVRDAQLSPDGKLVVTASDDDTARLWDAGNGELLGRWGHSKSVRSARFSPDGRRVATASEDKLVRLWDLETGRLSGELKGHEREVYSARFSADGESVVTASKDSTARLWNVGTGEALAVLDHPDEVLAAQLDGDGKRVVTACADKIARLWDAGTGKLLKELTGHEDWVRDAQFDPAGKLVVTASDDGSARLWDAATGQPLGEPMRHQAAIYAARFDAEGRRVVTASTDGTARVWDVATEPPSGAPLRHDTRVDAAHFSRDGRRVVVTTTDGAVHVWNTATAEPLGEPAKHEAEPEATPLSTGGRRSVNLSGNGTARLQDTTTDQPIGEPLRHASWINTARFSPDGRRVVTASADGTARLWDAETGLPLGGPLRHDDVVNAAQLSPDGRRVVTASDDGTARLWDTPVGSPADSIPLARLAEAVVGYRINELGAMVPVDRPDLELRGLRDEAKRQAAGNPEWDVWDFICWFLADSPDRTPSSFSFVCK